MYIFELSYIFFEIIILKSIFIVRELNGVEFLSGVNVKYKPCRGFIVFFSHILVINGTAVNLKHR